MPAPVLDDFLRSLLPQTSHNARITRSQLALGGTHNTTEVGFYSRPENVLSHAMLKFLNVIPTYPDKETKPYEKGKGFAEGHRAGEAEMSPGFPTL